MTESANIAGAMLALNMLSSFKKIPYTIHCVPTPQGYNHYKHIIIMETGVFSGYGKNSLFDAVTDTLSHFIKCHSDVRDFFDYLEEELLRIQEERKNEKG